MIKILNSKQTQYVMVSLFLISFIFNRYTFSAYFGIVMSFLFCTLVVAWIIGQYMVWRTVVINKYFLFTCIGIFSIYTMYQQILLVAIISLVVYMFFVQINEFSFRHFFHKIYIKLKTVELVRLKIIPSSANPDIFIIKQNIYKSLHSMAELKPTIGEFIPFFQNIKSIDIVNKWWSARQERSIKFNLGMYSDSVTTYQYIDIPKTSVKQICQVISSTYQGTTFEEIQIPESKGVLYEGIIYGDWRTRIKSFKDNKSDPIDAILNSLQDLKTDEVVDIQYHLVPIGGFYNAIIDEKLEKVPEKASRGAKDNSIEAMSSDKAGGVLFQFRIKIYIDSENSEDIFSKIKNSYLQVQEMEKNYISFGDYRSSYDTQSVIGEADLWGLWHITNKSSKMKANRFVPLPPPNEILNKNFYLEFGKSNHHAFTDSDIGLATVQDRCRHITITGRTGSGKSTLVRQLFLQELKKNIPMFFMDFKGETAKNLINDIPKDRLMDIVYISPLDYITPMSLFDGDEKQIMLFLDIADGIGNINMQGGFGNKIERNANVLASIIASQKNPTIRGIQNLINEILNHKQDIKNLKLSGDLRTKIFATSIDVQPKPKVVDYLSSLIHNIDKLLVDDVCINSMDNPKAELNFRDCIDKNKIVIINLPEAIGERERVSLGIFYTLKILYAIKSQKTYKNTAFYLDEAQVVMNMLSDVFESSFSQLRGLNCGVTIANQYMKQADKNVIDSINNNIATFVTLGTLDDEEIKYNAGRLGVDLEQYSKDNFRLAKLGNGFIRTICDGDVLPACSFQFPDIEVSKNKNFSAIKKLNKRDYGVSIFKFERTAIRDNFKQLEQNKIIKTKRPERRK